MKVIINKLAFIEWNDNNQKSVKEAEKRKAHLENLGYTLESIKTNIITGENTLTYKK